jgi:hypothetical protein
VIDHRNEPGNRELPFRCDLFYRRPKLVFDADARLVSVDDNGSLDDW